MICWDRQGERIIGTFTPRQLRWIREHLGSFRVFLERAIDGRDTGLRAGGGYLQAVDIAQRRLNGNAPVNSDGFPAAHFLRKVVQDIDTVVDALPPSGGVVVLPDTRHAWAWVWSLYECGMEMAFRLKLEWGPLDDMKETATGRHGRSFCSLMTWLIQVIEGLIEVVDLPDLVIIE